MTSYESECTLNVGALEREKISKLESLLEDYKEELSKYDDLSVESVKVNKFHFVFLLFFSI